MSVPVDPVPVLMPVDRAAFSVVPRSQSGYDLAYWLTRSSDERLQAVEVQRLIVYGRPHPAARLRRVLEVAERASG